VQEEQVLKLDNSVILIVFFFNNLEQIFYIGDFYSVQLFQIDGRCIQRIRDIDHEEFRNVYGISVMDDQLWVCYLGNRRIQIFRPQC